jgi:hypothetical protein
MHVKRRLGHEKRLGKDGPTTVFRRTETAAPCVFDHSSQLINNSLSGIITGDETWPVAVYKNKFCLKWTTISGY